MLLSFLEEDCFQDNYIIIEGRDNLSESMILDHEKRQSLDLQNPLVQDCDVTPLLEPKPKQGYGKKCPIC